MSTTKIPTLNELAVLAECQCNGPHAAAFLSGVYDSYRQDLPQYEDAEEGIHELADGSVPIYNIDRWEAFVELQAWQEDISDYGKPESLTDGAGVALYIIARRLLEELRLRDQLD